MFVPHSPANRPMNGGRAHEASRQCVGMIVLMSVVALLGILTLAASLA